MCPQHPELIPSGTLCLGPLCWNALPPELGRTDSISHFGLSSNVRSPLTPVSDSWHAAAQGPNPADPLILYHLQAWILQVCKIVCVWWVGVGEEKTKRRKVLRDTWKLYEIQISVCVNKVLPGLRHACLSIYCLHVLSHDNVSWIVEIWTTSPQTLKYLLWPLREDVCQVLF